MSSKISDERLAEILGSDMAMGTSEQVGALIWELAREVSEYRAREAATVTGETSDGYHTFDELYEYRMLYNAHAAHGWLAAGIPVVKSWRHSDGEECFGGGWFIVTAELPAGQVSNHYEAKHWGLFKVTEVDTAPMWDGHTPKDAARRLRIEAEHACKPSEAVGDDD